MMHVGLTISDKPALLDAKNDGAKYVVLRKSGFMNKMLFAPDVVDIINIDLALAQIAEMESAEKPCPYCSTDAFSPSRIGLYGEKGFSPFHVYFPGGSAREGEQFDYCPKCARRINSPYTEGENENA